MSIHVDNGVGIIVRITPWNETSSRKRNNIVDELRYLPYFFFFFLLFTTYLAFKEKREGTKWKERNDRRKFFDS